MKIIQSHEILIRKALITWYNEKCLFPKPEAEEITDKLINKMYEQSGIHESIIRELIQEQIFCCNVDNNQLAKKYLNNLSKRLEVEE